MKKLVLSEKKVEVNFNVTITNAVPLGGAIQIIFPSRIPNVYPLCRSSITVGSGLKQVSGNFGNVGCLVQSNSWVLTGFSALAAGSNLKVSGVIDLPNDGVAGYMGDMAVSTYGTHEYSNIYNIGRIVDRSLALAGSGLTTVNFKTKSIEDVDVLHIETKHLRISNQVTKRISPPRFSLGLSRQTKKLFSPYANILGPFKHEI